MYLIAGWLHFSGDGCIVVYIASAGVALPQRLTEGDMNRRMPLFMPEPVSDPTPSWVADAFPPEARLDNHRFMRSRLKLHALDGHFHCSLIGTCLGPGELRKLVPRHADVDRLKADDLEIHHAAVQLAGEGGPGSKALHKLLDSRYATEIRRFQAWRSEAEVRDAWRNCLQRGEVPGAYWALMTHPAVTPALRQLAFGEVHMLSHLVGAANRADIRRLLAQDKEIAELKEKVERQQSRLHELARERAAALREAVEHKPLPGGDEAQARIQALEALLRTREQALAHQTARTRQLESRVADGESRLQALREHLAEARSKGDQARAERDALEAHLAPPQERLQPLALVGKRIVYVGGRPHSTQAIQQMVHAAGGELVVHDGGIEDRLGLLVATLGRADLVVFPVDCIAHNPVSVLKRTCERHGVPYLPLRSAGIASFAAAMAEWARREAPDSACSPSPSHFCLRHG